MILANEGNEPTPPLSAEPPDPVPSYYFSYSPGALVLHADANIAIAMQTTLFGTSSTRTDIGIAYSAWRGSGDEVGVFESFVLQGARSFTVRARRFMNRMVYLGIGGGYSRSYFSIQDFELEQERVTSSGPSITTDHATICVDIGMVKHYSSGLDLTLRFVEWSTSPSHQHKTTLHTGDLTEDESGSVKEQFERSTALQKSLGDTWTILGFGLGIHF